MKTVQASLALNLVEGVNKTFVDGAVVTCKEANFPCIRKSDGCYVFTDLPKGKYTFVIQKPGFITKEYEVEIGDVQPVIKTVTVQYSVDNYNTSFMNQIVFTLKQKGEIIPNKDVVIKVNTKNPYLRVIEPVTRGSNLLKLNCDFDVRLLYQNYTYDKKANTIICFSSYDHINKSYVLSNTYRSKINEGGLLSPYWEMKTDDKGRILFVINPIFCLKNEIDLSLTIDKKTTNITVDISKSKAQVELEVK